MLLGEVVAPAAPALGALIEIAVLLFAFAFVWTVRKLIAALFGWLISLLELIPVLGGYLAQPFHTAEQAVAHALGAAEHAVDSAIGASWHLLARYMEWLWREIRGNAVLALEIATGIYPIVVAVRWVKNHVLHVGQVSAATAAQVRTLERELHGIDRELRTLEREYHGIDAIRVGKRLGKIEAQLGAIEAQTIPAIQQAENDAASAISNLYAWARGKASILGVGTFSLAVAASIGMDVFNGLRCTNFGNLMRKFGCGLGSLLDALLGIMVSIIGLEVVCDYLPYMEAAFGAIEGPLVHILTEVPLGTCEIPPPGWAKLSVGHGPLPPPQKLGRFAA